MGTRTLTYANLYDPGRGLRAYVQTRLHRGKLTAPFYDLFMNYVVHARRRCVCTEPMGEMVHKTLVVAPTTRALLLLSAHIFSQTHTHDCVCTYIIYVCHILTGTLTNERFARCACVSVPVNRF